MAVKALEGFDKYVTAAQVFNRRGFLQWQPIAGVGCDLVPGRYNSAGQAAHFTYNQTMEGTFATNYESFFIGFGVNWTNGAGSQPYVVFLESVGGTEKARVTLNLDGSIGFMALGTDPQRTGANVQIQGSWFFMEIGVVVHPSAGSIIVKINNQAVVSYTGVNTAGSSNEFINQVAFQGFGPDSNLTIDDVYIADATGPAPYNTFLGDNRVYALSVDAAGDLTQFTPSAGANYQNVETVGSTYNSSATAGNADLFKLTGLPTNVTEILAVQVTGVYSKTDATDHTVTQQIKSGGVTATGTGFLSPYAMTNSELFYSDDPIVNDPSTGQPFTLSAMNAGVLQIGYTLAT